MNFNDMDLAAAEQHEVVMRFEDDGYEDFQHWFRYKERYGHHQAEDAEDRIKADLFALYNWSAGQGDCASIRVKRSSDGLMLDSYPANGLEVANIYNDIEVIVTIDRSYKAEMTAFKLAFCQSS